ncbi:unnamed protein product [Rotaria sp. Silwood2]|nr:unnamed protein product [Rotaria sp. Silwood2]
MWNDYSLRWKPEEFGNIQTLRIPTTQIWTPDIFLYNSVNDKFDTATKINAVVQHNGDILYVPPVLFKSICSFNIAAFPFVSIKTMFQLYRTFILNVCLFLDTQHCTLKFGSWTYDDAGVNLTAESSKGQLDAYVTSAEWDLEGSRCELCAFYSIRSVLDFTATNNRTKYDCCPSVYPYVLYTIQIRRRSLYYFTTIVVPCFLISCMSLLGFLLPPDGGDKINLRELEFDDKKCVLIHSICLEITTLLSVVMFCLLLSEILPPTSTAIPMITVYFMCVMTMSALSVVASVLILSFHFRNSKSHTMPLWVRKYICNYLAWLLLMKRPDHDLNWRGIRRRWASSKQESNNINKSIDNHHSKIPSEPLLDNTFELLSTNVMNIDKKPLELLENREKQGSDSLLEFSVPSTTKIHDSGHHQNTSKELYTCDTEPIRSELRIIISHLTILTNHSRQQDKEDDESQDWKFMARVIDRLCLVVFAVFMILFTVLNFINI